MVDRFWIASSATILCGTACVIVPQGVLFGSGGAFKTLRQMLVERCDLKAVVTLPSGVFKPYAGVSTAILLFTKVWGPKDKVSKPAAENVWFYEMAADGYSLDDKRSKQEGYGGLQDIITRYHSRNPATDTDRTAKCFMVPRSEIDELRRSPKGLMPEGFESDLKPQDLADVIACVQSFGQVGGNKNTADEPITVDDQGVLHLTAHAGTSIGPQIKFMPTWQAFGWFTAEDRVEWDVNVPRAGQYDVWLEWSVADAAAIGNVVIPAMEKRGYSRTLSAAIVSNAASAAILIPPSIMLIVFAAAAGVSDVLGKQDSMDALADAVRALMEAPPR